MKTLRYSFLLFAIAFMANTASVNAQSYTSAVGVRLGVPIAASYKTFLNESSALEINVGYRSRKVLGFGYTQLNITGLYEIHSSISDNLQWYFGGGGGIYIFSFDDGFGFGGDDDGSLSIGISGVLGLEYVFPDTPITVGADWLPTFFVNGYGSGFGAGYGALSVRYILNR